MFTTWANGVNESISESSWTASRQRWLGSTITCYLQSWFLLVSLFPLFLRNVSLYAFYHRKWFQAPRAEFMSMHGIVFPNNKISRGTFTDAPSSREPDNFEPGYPACPPCGWQNEGTCRWSGILLRIRERKPRRVTLTWGLHWNLISTTPFFGFASHLSVVNPLGPASYPTSCAFVWIKSNPSPYDIWFREYSQGIGRCSGQEASAKSWFREISSDIPWLGKPYGLVWPESYFWIESGLLLESSHRKGLLPALLLQTLFHTHGHLDQRRQEIDR